MTPESTKWRQFSPYGESAFTATNTVAQQTQRICLEFRNFPPNDTIMNRTDLTHVFCGRPATVSTGLCSLDIVKWAKSLNTNIELIHTLLPSAQEEVGLFVKIDPGMKHWSFVGIRAVKSETAAILEIAKAIMLDCPWFCVADETFPNISEEWSSANDRKDL